MCVCVCVCVCVRVHAYVHFEPRICHEITETICKIESLITVSTTMARLSEPALFRRRVCVLSWDFEIPILLHCS